MTLIASFATFFAAATPFGVNGEATSGEGAEELNVDLAVDAEIRDSVATGRVLQGAAIPRHRRQHKLPVPLQPLRRAPGEPPHHALRHTFDLQLDVQQQQQHACADPTKFNSRRRRPGWYAVLFFLIE
eukprot:SAG31_NODE_34_length_31842_cov_31.677850_22_plen_128_part_00